MYRLMYRHRPMKKRNTVSPVRMVALTRTELNNFERANRAIEEHFQYSTFSKDPKISGASTGRRYANELPDNAGIATSITHSHKCHFTQQETKEIIKGYTEQHLTVYQLADRHGCHRDTVSRLLKQNGVQVARRRMADEQVARAIELYQSGWSLREIAKELELSKSNVQCTLHKAGVKMRPAKRAARSTLA